MIVHRPPGNYSDFIKEFTDFLTSSIIRADKVDIVGDYNIHIENDGHPLKKAFIPAPDSVAFTQNVVGPAHLFDHTLS